MIRRFDMDKTTDRASNEVVIRPLEFKLRGNDISSIILNCRRWVDRQDEVQKEEIQKAKEKKIQKALKAWEPFIHAAQALLPELEPYREDPDLEPQEAARINMPTHNAGSFVYQLPDCSPITISICKDISHHHGGYFVGPCYVHSYYVDSSLTGPATIEVTDHGRQHQDLRHAIAEARHNWGERATLEAECMQRNNELAEHKMAKGEDGIFSPKPTAYDQEIVAINGALDNAFLAHSIDEGTADSYRGQAQIDLAASIARSLARLADTLPALVKHY
jgi:hypothetical protein